MVRSNQCPMRMNSSRTRALEKQRHDHEPQGIHETHPQPVQRLNLQWCRGTDDRGEDRQEKNRVALGLVALVRKTCGERLQQCLLDHRFVCTFVAFQHSFGFAAYQAHPEVQNIGTPPRPWPPSTTRAWCASAHRRRARCKAHARKCPRRCPAPCRCPLSGRSARFGGWLRRSPVRGRPRPESGWLPAPETRPGNSKNISAPESQG